MGYQLMVVGYWLLVVGYWLLTNNKQPTTSN